MIREYSSIPKYLHTMLKVKGKFDDRIKVIGADTETYRGRPQLLQFCDGYKVEIKRVNDENVTEKFFDYLNDLPEGKYVMFFHNLEFDLPVLFFPFMENFFYEKLNTCYLKGRWNIKIIYGKCRFATIQNEKKKIKILDSFQFFRSSLKKLSYSLNLKHKKIDPPADLGETETVTKELLKYARQDAWVQYDLAEYIINQHRFYDINPTVSIAQMSAKIFKKQFLKDSIISLPSRDIIDAAIKSYHGGLNIFTADMGMYENVYEIDINSAYPHAMTQIPNFNKCGYSKIDYVDYFREGIYNITGVAKSSKYPILFNHDFSPIKEGLVNDVWVTSYELKEALRTHSFELHSVTGYVIDEKESEYNPFSEFAKNFYHLKQITDKSNPNYIFYKLILNSLYGKTIQGIPVDKYRTRIYHDIDTGISRLMPIKFRAGGLFHPFIATLVTGFVRAKLRRVALEYQAFDTSTDSIKTQIKPDPKMLNDELGGWSVDTFGDCLLLRNKLYIHFGEKIKAGLHAFRGTVDDLLRMWIEKSNEYEYEKMVKIKEAKIRKDSLSPLTFEKMHSSLKLFPDKPKQKIMIDDRFDIDAETDRTLTKSERIENIKSKIDPAFKDFYLK